MKRILYIMFGMPSCYNSGIAFGTKLSDAGFDVHIACDKDISRQAHNAKLEFSYLSLEERYASHDPGSKKSRTSRFNKKYKNSGNRQASIEDSEIQTLIETLKPDSLIIDIECHLAIIASRKYKIPTAICTRQFDHRYHKFLPPLNSPLSCDQSRMNQCMIAIHWRLLWVSNALHRLKSHISSARLRPVNYRSFRIPDLLQIAEHHGIDLKDFTTTKDWYRPFTYHGLPILSLTAKELDFEGERRPGFHYLGPMIAKATTTFITSARDTDQIAQFLKMRDPHKNYLIYCSMGTWLKAKPQFLNAIYDVAYENPDFMFIIGLGGNQPEKALSKDYKNVCVVKSAPQTDLLKIADACILHGGIASINEAITQKVPMILCSTGTNDQNGNVSRLVYQKLALSLKLSELSGKLLYSNLITLLNNPDIKDRITYCEAHFSAYSTDQLKDTIDALTRGALEASPAPF